MTKKNNRPDKDSAIDGAKGDVSRPEQASPVAPALQILQNKELQLQLITETISEVFWISDFKTEKILYASSAYERIWSLSLSTLYEIPRSYIDAVVDEDRAVALSSFDQRKAGLPWDVQYRIRRPGDTVIWIWDRGYPIFLPSGEVSYYVGLARDITETKTALEKLRQSEEKYKAVFENAPIGILTVDRYGHILDVNSTLVSLLGSPSAEETRKINMFVFPLLVQSGFADEIRKVFNDGKPVSGERQYFSKWGKELFFHYKVNPINWRDDKVETALVVLEDISGSKNAEVALQKSEEKFRRVFDHSTVGISLTGLDGSVQVNQAICDMLGYTREEFKGKCWQGVTHPDDHEETNREIQSLLEGKKTSVSFMQRYIKKDGSLVWGMLSSALVRDDNNEPLYFVSSVIDVHKSKMDGEAMHSTNEKLETFIKENTLALEKVNAALNDARQLIDAHMDNSLMAIIEFDSDFRVIRWSGQAERIFGWTANEVLGKTFKEIKWVHPDDLTMVERVFEGLSSGKIKNNLNINRNYGKDGAMMYCEWYNSLIFGQQGRLKSILSSVIDITARKQIEIKLRENEERLQKAFTVAPSVIVFSGSEDGKYIDVNEKFCSLTGYTKQEVIGKTPPELGICSEQVHHLLKTEFEKYGMIKETQITLRAKNGSRVHLEVSMEPVEMEGQTVILTIGRDITHHSQVEETLRLTQFAVENASDATYWITPEGRFEYVNDAACRQLGYTREELLALSVADIDSEFPTEKWQAHWEDIKKRGSFIIETTHRNKSGQIVLVEVKVNYINYGGREYNCAFSRDITKRKEAEKALKESEAKFHLIVEHSPDILWTMNANLEIDYVSPSVFQILGYTPEEHIQQNLDDYLTPESAEMIRNEFREGMMNLKKKQFDKLRSFATLEVEFIRKDRSHGYARISLNNIRDEQNRIMKIRGVTADITEQKTKELALLERVKKLEEELSRRG